MYAKSIRPSAKREVQKERSAKRDVQKFQSAQHEDRIARPRRTQTCELRPKRAMRMCPRSVQVFSLDSERKKFFLILSNFSRM